MKTISTVPIPDPPEILVVRIQGGGRTLMPGLLDAHTHLMFSTIPQQLVLSADIDCVNVAAVKAANDSRRSGHARRQTGAVNVHNFVRAETNLWTCPGRASSSRCASM